MTVEVRLFAMLREAQGSDRIAVDLPAGAAVPQLKAAIAEQYPALAEFLPKVRVSASLAFVGDDYVFERPEELALIPPVSGG